MHIQGIELAVKDCETSHNFFRLTILFWFLYESNPMLAETFEDVRMKLIVEKVRHHPLEIAYHAEGEGWKLVATTCGKTKFWGM